MTPLWSTATFCSSPLQFLSCRNLGLRTSSLRVSPRACASKPRAEQAEPGPRNTGDGERSGNDYDEFSRLLGNDGKDIQRRVELGQARKERKVDESAYKTFDSLLGGGGRKLKGGRQFVKMDDVRRKAKLESQKKEKANTDLSEVSPSISGTYSNAKANAMPPAAGFMSEAEIADAYAFMEDAFATPGKPLDENGTGEPTASVSSDSPGQSRPPVLNKPSLSVKPKRRTDEQEGVRSGPSPPDPTRIRTADLGEPPTLRAKSAPSRPRKPEAPTASADQEIPGQVDETAAEIVRKPNADTTPLSDKDIDDGYREMELLFSNPKGANNPSSPGLNASPPASETVPPVSEVAVKKPRHPDEARTDILDPTRLKTANLDMGPRKELATPPPSPLNKPVDRIVEAGTSLEDPTTQEESEKVVAVSDVLSIDIDAEIDAEIDAPEMPRPLAEVLLTPPVPTPAAVGSEIEHGDKGRVAWKDIPAMLLENPKIISHSSRMSVSTDTENGTFSINSAESVETALMSASAGGPASKSSSAETKIESLESIAKEPDVAGSSAENNSVDAEGFQEASIEEPGGQGTD